MDNSNTSWIFTGTCPSWIGTIDTVTSYMSISGNYINELHSFDDHSSGTFFIRIEFTPNTETFCEETFAQEFDERANKFAMNWSLTPVGHRPNVGILVSKYDHCLNDLLFRYRTGQLSIEIPVIISNHCDLEPLAAWHNIPFYHLPVTAETKGSQETEIRKLLEQYEVELVVLARYMQILSPQMCEYLDGKAINIHHSLLPGFKGARPYHQAWEKGVKMVGATAHYVNNDLDEGPIITQGIQTVDHAHYPENLVAKGQDVERITLFNAVRFHIQKRVFINGSRTVVFSN